jgi:hypothetical protein
MNIRTIDMTDCYIPEENEMVVRINRYPNNAYETALTIINLEHNVAFGYHNLKEKVIAENAKRRLEQ